MRLRFVPEAQGIVEASPYVIHDDRPFEKPISTYYSNEAPLHVEIGTGKGGFLVELARRNPDINYLGVECYESVLYKAIEKLDAIPENEKLTNIRLFARDARLLPELLKTGEVDRLYLNFSDPWPKKRHAKRRLTSHQFLALYEQFLKPGGELVFKTDNKDLFAFSLEELEEAPHWHITAKTFDLHRDPVMNEGNIMTEYERKFSALGTTINKLIAVYEP
ncbi:MAG: tRNA (guanosine(46)-N7)-methyltransferase TrmB [Lachnospiraceae bacterium]|nr:tRNA (guanosine(46)-N7)-methyltransferase TrmB [Lachnospiraceae bacterium]